LLPKVGECTAATLWAAVGGNPDPVGSFLRLDMRKAPAGAQGPLKKLAATLESLRRPSLQAAPAEAIRFAVDEGGYADVAKSKFANHRTRLDDLEALAQFALPYDGVESFLEEITLFGEPTGETVIAAEKDDERLVLSSIHQAKGLEWRAVFVIGLVEDRFPNVRAAKTAEGLGGGRRLFYVAATRAKDELVLVHPLAVFDRYGIVVVTESSRFLRELPENLLERWVLEAGQSLSAVGRGVHGVRGGTAPGQGLVPRAGTLRGACRGHPAPRGRELRAYRPPERDQSRHAPDDGFLGPRARARRRRDPALVLHGRRGCDHARRHRGRRVASLHACPPGGPRGVPARHDTAPRHDARREDSRPSRRDGSVVRGGRSAGRRAGRRMFRAG